MTILNQLNIGNVSEKNDGLLGGISTDIRNLTGDISSAAANALMPGKIVIENSAHTISNPFDNILNPKEKNGSYKKLLKFIPATVASSITKALKLPFASVEKAIEYGINNNLERGIESLKGVSTKLIANLLTDNGNTNSKIMKGLGWISEGVGDTAGTLIKAFPWLMGEVSKLPNHGFKGYGLNSLDKMATNLLKTTLIDPNKEFFKPKLMNSADITNNAGYTPEKSTLKYANNTDYIPKEKAA